jgi:hypothetical protein
MFLFGSYEPHNNGVNVFSFKLGKYFPLPLPEFEPRVAQHVA